MFEKYKTDVIVPNKISRNFFNAFSKSDSFIFSTGGVLNLAPMIDWIIVILYINMPSSSRPTPWRRIFLVANNWSAGWDRIGRESRSIKTLKWLWLASVVVQSTLYLVE